MMEYFFQSKFCLSVFIRQPAQHVSSLQLKFTSHCWTPQRGGQAVVWWRICSKLWPQLRNIRGKWFDELFGSCNKVSESSYCNCPLGDGRSSQWGVQRADRQLSKSKLSLVNSCWVSIISQWSTKNKPQTKTHRRPISPTLWLTEPVMTKEKWKW